MSTIVMQYVVGVTKSGTKFEEFYGANRGKALEVAYSYQNEDELNADGEEVISAWVDERNEMA